MKEKKVEFRDSEESVEFVEFTVYNLKILLNMHDLEIANFRDCVKTRKFKVSSVLEF